MKKVILSAIALLLISCGSGPGASKNLGLSISGSQDLSRNSFNGKNFFSSGSELAGLEKTNEIYLTQYEIWKP